MEDKPTMLTGALLKKAAAGLLCWKRQCENTYSVHLGKYTIAVTDHSSDQAVYSLKIRHDEQGDIDTLYSHSSEHSIHDIEKLYKYACSTASKLNTAISDIMHELDKLSWGGSGGFKD